MSEQALAQMSSADGAREMGDFAVVAAAAAEDKIPDTVVQELRAIVCVSAALQSKLAGRA